MREIVTMGRSVSVPECVDELTAEQYEYYLMLSMALSNRDIGVDFFRVRWLSFLLGMCYDYTMLIDEYAEEIDGQSDVVDGFIDVHDDGSMSLSFATCRNLLPEYDGHRGPGDWLSGMTFGAFVECLTVLGGADEDGMESAYEHVARVMYGIPEDEEVPAMLSVHAPILFGRVWNTIMSQPIEINGGMIDIRIIFQGGGGRADDHTGWTGVTYEVATAGLFGTVREVENTDLWQVLIYLYKCKFEYLNDKSYDKA